MWQLLNIQLSIDQRPILQNVHVQIEPGDFIALKGANGAGKSTLFNVLSGCLAPCQGEILRHGFHITSLNEQKRALWVGKLTQDPAQSCIKELTVEQNLSIAKLKLKKASLSRIKDPIDEPTFNIATELGFDLDKYRNTLVGSLSGGQRQMLALIMVLLNHPELLLLDEPTAALDEEASGRFLTFIHTWIQKHQIAALMISHDPQETLFCNKSWLLQEGKIQEVVSSK
jgi:putative ABC transport system ATP-binding protein